MQYLAKKVSQPQYLLVLFMVVALGGCVSYRNFTGDLSQSCGNSVVDPGEQCDLGNRHGGAGCSPECQVETGWACRGGKNGQTDFCHLVTCGDGIIDKGEQCDDENTNANDGCSPSCVVEKGWMCSGEPSKCHPIACGDGIVDKGEHCDDGNVRNGDGCDAFCGMEMNWTCSGSPSVCKKTPVMIKFKANDSRESRRRNPYVSVLRGGSTQTVAQGTTTVGH